MRKIRSAGVWARVRHLPAAEQEGLIVRVTSLAVVVVFMGCGPKPPDEVVPPPPSFVADPAGAGPALITRATISGTDVDVSVVGQKLGPVLGYAFTLRFEGLTAVGDAVAAEAVGPNAFGEAVYLAKLSPGALAIGGARQGAAAGEKTLDDETVLARLKLRLDGSTATLKLGGTSVRRADGTAVVVTAAGGKIGGAP